MTGIGKDATKRALDLEIAVKIMGYVWQDYKSARALFNPDGDLVAIEETKGVIRLPGYGKTWLPEFQSLMDDAWLVVEKMRERGFWLKLVTDWTGAGETSAGFMEFETVDCGSSWVRAKAPTAPEAICRAALKALGTEANDL